MICTNCGTSVPEGRNKCPRCGIWLSVPPHIDPPGDMDNWETPEYPPPPPPSEERGAPRYLSTPHSMSVPPLPDQGPKKVVQLGRWDNKWLAFVLGIITSILGLFTGFFIFSFLYFFPVVAFIMLFALAVFPLIGSLLIAAGIYKPGAIILIIGSVLMIPIGLVGIFGGGIALNLAKAEKIYSWQEEHYTVERPPALRRTSREIKILAIVLSIIFILIPLGYYYNYISQPQVKIDNVDIPAFTFGRNVTITVELLNVGNEKADGDKIEIEVRSTLKTEKFQWTAGDVPAGERMDDQFDADIGDSPSFEFKSVTVLYDGEESHSISFEDGFP